MDHAAAVAHHDVLGRDAEPHVELRAGDARRSGAVEDDADFFQRAAGELRGIQQCRTGDDRGAVLVVVEDRDVEALDQQRFDLEALDERTRAIRELSGASSGPVGPAPLKAPMPGLIVRINVQVGDPVQAGQGLVVMEAMKMENELRAQAAGKVKAIIASPGTAVEKGALLIELE